MFGLSLGCLHVGVVVPVPVDRTLALSYGFLEAARRDQRHHARILVTLTELWCDVERVADVRPVQPAELDGIHPEIVGDVLHVGLEGVERLWGPVPAIGARDRDVGVGDPAVESFQRRVVGAEATEAGDHLHGEPVCAVGTRVRDHPHLLSGQLCRWRQRRS